MDHGDHGGFEQPRPRGRPSRHFQTGNATDIGNTYVHWMLDRRAKTSSIKGFEAERPTLSWTTSMLPPAARRGKAVDTIPAKHLHSSFNKHRAPVNVVTWTPDGRRLVTGNTSGELTLWNGTGFNFETIFQAHADPIRAAVYSHSDEWLISADQLGGVKYYQSNFNPVTEFDAHGDAVRDLAFSPNDSKFVTASDDASLKIWDFASSQEESTLQGHQWDAKCVDWHPSKGLLVSGSKDHQIKLWDPRSGRCLTTLHGHKNTVNMTKFEPSRGTLLASCARDQTVRIFDLHMMRDVFLLKGHEREVNSLVWHPFHSNLLTTGAADGAMCHFLLDEQHPPPGTPLSVSPYDTPNPADAPAQTIYPAHKIAFAHEFNIWSMAWHPMGHILASGSNDRATRFWTRPRPGEGSFQCDKWHIGLGGLPGLGAGIPPPNPAPGNDMFNAPQPNFHGLPPPPPGMDIDALQQALRNGQAPPMPPGFPPPGFPPPPQGYPPGFPPPPGGLPGFGATPPASNGAGGGSIRKRAPLPSQADSLREEMKQGRYLKPR
ncbi:Polyadenylation factor subunit 2, partial [Pseudocercospora fuligena]